MIALLGTVFAAGFVGSAHCLGMCGPLALAGTVRAPGANSPALRRLGLFQLGRLLSYSSIGALAGGIGAAVDLAGALAGLTQVAVILAGTVMIGSGVLTLVRVARGEAHGGSALGAWISRWVGPRLARTSPAFRPLVLGATTGLLPCGFLWSFALGAAGTGHPLQGALVMAAFALGTAPATLGLAGLAAAAGRRLGTHTTALIALLVIAAGVVTVARRGALDVRAWARPDTAPTAPAEEHACCHGDPDPAEGARR